MSLTVPENLLAKARAGEVSDAEFLDCMRTSLPYAFGVVDRLAKRMAHEDLAAAEDGTAPPSEQEHAELLRLVGSDAMRDAIERHYGVRLAFQNCCKIGLFRPSASAEHAEFTSVRAQLLNQTPALINC